MGDDVLSQEEVESLLGAMQAGLDSDPNQDDSAKAAPSVAAPTLPPVGLAGSEKVIPYDFKRPERVGKEQIRALQSMHEGFSRNFAVGLSALLRSIAEVKLTSVDQLTYSEFIFSLENPSCFNLLRAEPLEGNLILDINPSILYPIIDRLLGGGKEASQAARRPLTEIELRLVRRITDLFLSELRSAWENVIELELSVDRVESNPQLVQIVPPNEVVILISFELTLGDLRGMLNLCIPYNTIERVSNKLTSNTWVSTPGKDTSPDSQESIKHRLRRSLVEVVVELAKTNISTGDLLGLRVGDIIATEQDANDPLSVTIEGVPTYYARPGSVKGHKAFQVEKSTPPVHVESPPPNGN